MNKNHNLNKDRISKAAVQTHTEAQGKGKISNADPWLTFLSPLTLRWSCPNLPETESIGSQPLSTSSSSPQNSHLASPYSCPWEVIPAGLVVFGLISLSHRSSLVMYFGWRPHSLRCSGLTWCSILSTAVSMRLWILILTVDSNPIVYILICCSLLL